MKKLVLSVWLLALAPISFAGDLMQWQDTSLTALYGTGFEVDPETQQTLTLEHASGWSFGDLFFFTDFTYFDGDEAGVGGAKEREAYYGEFSPRLSAGKILKKDLSVLFIKDWLIAGCYEFGEDAFGEDFGVQNYLIGAGVDLDIPYFDFVQLNAYQRIPDSGDGETVQITPVWKISFPMGESSFICDGYIDWVVNSDGAYEKNLHINPQFKIDVGALLGIESGSLLAGVEYDYWKNKYGIKDSSGFKTTQSAISGIVQYHF